jgi:hypothetical protein
MHQMGQWAAAMSDKTPDLWERFRAWVFGRFGMPGLIVLACVPAAVLVKS